MRSKQEIDVLRSVFNRAWNDASFKAELIANPTAAIASVTGQEVNSPEGRELVVLDQTDPNFFYLNIPPAPEMESQELTEEQLEMVAGGTSIPDTLLIFDPIICFPPTTPPYNPFPGPDVIA